MQPMPVFLRIYMHCSLSFFLSSATKPSYLQPSNSAGYLHPTRKQELSHRTQASSAGDSPMYTDANVFRRRPGIRTLESKANKQTDYQTHCCPSSSFCFCMPLLFILPGKEENDSSHLTESPCLHRKRALRRKTELAPAVLAVIVKRNNSITK